MRTAPVRRALLAGLALLVTACVWAVPAPSMEAATVDGTIIGEGSDGVTPLMVKLLHDDAAGLKPDFGSYTGTVGVDQGTADFVGSAPGTFGSDYLVTERPLTTAEAAAAAANGRSFAYVPFAASPVALMTLVPNSSYTGSTTILPSQFCQHVPLSLDQLDGIFGAVNPPYSSWGDSRLSCTASPSAPADAVPFGRWANLDPTMENFALMTLLDSTPTSKSAFGDGLTNAQKNGQATTGDPSASEHWPYSGTAVAGGDQTTLGKLIGLDARTGAPSSTAAQLMFGATMPVESDWTGDPLGVRWDLPTAAVENAAGGFVAPSAASAKAAEGDATLASTSDPTTDNLVTFNANAADATAYNNYLMLPAYLVVPTNGLSGDKARALAQLIRFAVGGTGQADITALGAAPATVAMVTADLAVAQELNAEAAATSGATTTTTTTASTASSTSGIDASSSGGTSTASTVATDGSTSGGTLASTGGNSVPLLGLGVVLLACGETARQILRRRKARS